MLLIFTFDKDGSTILGISSPERYPNKTIEQIREAAAISNEKAGYARFVLKEVPEEYENAFNFFLGEDKYKSYRTFETVSDDLDNIRSYLEATQRSLDDCFAELDWIKERVEKYLKGTEESLKKQN